MTLAYQTYEHTGPIGDRDGILDLAWTSDESALISPRIGPILCSQLMEEADCALPHVGQYAVHDPFGDAMLKDGVGTYFGLSGQRPATFVGAGVSSLVASISLISRSKSAIILGSTYPDFPTWAQRYGLRLTWVRNWANPDRLREHIAEVNADLIFAERPQFFKNAEVPMEAWCAALAALNSTETIAIIDESNANYLSPSYSLVHTLEALQNVAVLRGVSKAYQLGGLRIGMAIAGARAAQRLKSVIPPMLASPLTMRLAKAILLKGDITSSLRARIASARSDAEAALTRSGFSIASPAHPALPYLLPTIDVAAANKLALAQIRGKNHLFWSDGVEAKCYRMSVPLDPDRLKTFVSRLDAAAK